MPCYARRKETGDKTVGDHRRDHKAHHKYKNRLGKREQFLRGRKMQVLLTSDHCR